MHTCSSCRRILSNSGRDALCLKCLYRIDRGCAFAEDDETKPGKHAALSMAEVGGADAAGPVAAAGC